MKKKMVGDKKKKVTQASIADRLGISRGFLTEIFKGRRRPSYKTSSRFEKITGISCLVFLGEKPEKIRLELIKWAKAA